MNDKLAERIIDLYNTGQSQRSIADICSVHYQIVHKILCTAGCIVTKEMEMMNAGMTPDQIAKMLGKSISTVNAHIPYSKVRYNREDATINAKRIRQMRNRKRENIISETPD